jgi:hypothetical protein
LVADSFGLSAAAIFVAGLTFLSGAVVAVRMSETHPQLVCLRSQIQFGVAPPKTTKTPRNKGLKIIMLTGENGTLEF